MTTTIDTNSASGYTIGDSNTADTITISDGPPENGFQTTQVVTATDTTIFANKGLVDVDGGGKGNAVILDNPDPAAGLQFLQVTDLGAGSTINGGNSNANSPDVAAYALNLQAYGSIGNTRPLKTQTSLLYGFSGIGGAGNISIANGVAAPITLNIGTLQATIAAGGSIGLTNNGTINDYASGITATGNITIDTTGGGGFNTGSGAGITSNTGSIVNGFQIAGDTNLGDGNGGGSMSAATGINWATGRNFTINANATITNSTSGNIFITAGGDFTMLTSPGSQANAPEIVDSAVGGVISLTALGNSWLTVDSTGTNAIVSNNGNITLAADAMVINKGVSAGTAAVSLVNGSAGQAIALGAANSPGMLGLTQAELNRITAGVVRIGSGTVGNITIATPITALTGRR